MLEDTSDADEHDLALVDDVEDNREPVITNIVQTVKKLMTNHSIENHIQKDKTVTEMLQVSL